MPMRVDTSYRPEPSRSSESDTLVSRVRRSTSALRLLPNSGSDRSERLDDSVAVLRLADANADAVAQARGVEITYHDALLRKSVANVVCGEASHLTENE